MLATLLSAAARIADADKVGFRNERSSLSSLARWNFLRARPLAVDGQID